MVGYRESRFSFNDPMDEWERKIAARGTGSGRMLRQGYTGLARDVADRAVLAGRGLYEMGARLLIPTRGLGTGAKTSSTRTAQPPKKKPKPKK